MSYIGFIGTVGRGRKFATKARIATFARLKDDKATKYVICETMGINESGFKTLHKIYRASN
ncbi:MAG: hypothetical protein KAR06_01425 [Deltaproteobacteria bacterium]|nr:hypothetical protein [Deltaproteobacteria bacterium]